MPPSRPVSLRRDACGPPRSPNRVAGHPLIAGEWAIVRNLNEMRHDLASICHHTSLIGSTGDGRPPPRRSKRRTETLGQETWRSSSPPLSLAGERTKEGNVTKIPSVSTEGPRVVLAGAALISFRSRSEPRSAPVARTSADRAGRGRASPRGSRRSSGVFPSTCPASVSFPPRFRVISILSKGRDGPTTDKTNRQDKPKINQ